MRTKLLITGVALIAMTAVATAQTPRGQRLLNGTGRGPAYVDNNKNNVCDNYENGKPCPQYGRRNGNFGRGNQGQGNYGRGQGYYNGRGRNYTDANKNGVCDYYETPVKK